MDPERTKLTAPERIYLGYTSFWYETSEEGLHDIEYVRADLLTTTSTSDNARRAAEEDLKAIIVRCEDGDAKADWRPVINRLAKHALASLAAPADNDAERDEIEAIRARAYNTPLFSAETYAHDIRRLLRLLTTTKEARRWGW